MPTFNSTYYGKEWVSLEYDKTHYRGFTHLRGFYSMQCQFKGCKSQESCEVTLHDKHYWICGTHLQEIELRLPPFTRDKRILCRLVLWVKSIFPS